MAQLQTTTPLAKKSPLIPVLLALFAVILFLMPYYANNYMLDVATMALFYVVLALGLNIVVGYAGLLDLGYSAFFAVGAYTSAILMTQFQMNFWLTFLIGGALAALAGIIIGAPTLRLRSDYLAIVTLGFGEIIRITALNLEITGSSSGIFGIPRPSIGGYAFTHLYDFYWAMLLLAILTLFAVNRLGNSRLGRAWKYIREDEDAAEAMGIDRVRVKLIAYALGAMFGGFAGSLFAVKMSAIAPESFNFMQSVMILLAIVFGGLGRLPGVVLGAVLVIILPELMRSFAEWRFLLFGIALVVMMIFRPQGLWPSGRGKTE
ncbi:branched-chain amino acid ABC transporter permease [Tumebacillus sp. DT12]|uniref:Branched-chain amino acid ABC transporter permease n=1 Tax=Tumebacillus lacus TaxID=2995335 RepID=A0ABT3X3W7_9BACL|nr:branched-chain amino acid ABC transporter permease [Tumebacillus lacus]MCX7571589.1 branched-chain amino acid ABC transporter permease [Tumebacillus lacus]